MANRFINNGNRDRVYFGELQNHCRWWLQPWNRKMLAPWNKRYDQTRQHIKKQRHYFANYIQTVYIHMSEAFVCRWLLAFFCIARKTSWVLMWRQGTSHASQFTSEHQYPRGFSCIPQEYKEPSTDKSLPHMNVYSYRFDVWYKHLLSLIVLETENWY